MENIRHYAGTWTALITPFTPDGLIDEPALRQLVRDQIAGGVTGIVPMGTTGESPTTTAEEDFEIFKIVVDEAAGRIKIMAGTGSNVTSDAVKYTKNAKAAGADCALVVCPYYNRPTQEGLRLHYLHIVEESGMPVIIYNIKGRTGVNMETETLMQLANHPLIVGVKEASGDLNQMRDVVEHRPNDFTVLSGDDSLTLELIKMGGDGVVSVSSNIFPQEMSQLVNHALRSNYEAAQEIHDHLTPCFNTLFIETNPIPVKYIAHRMGKCALSYRMPLLPPSPQAQETLNAMIQSYNLQTHELRNRAATY